MLSSAISPCLLMIHALLNMFMGPVPEAVEHEAMCISCHDDNIAAFCFFGSVCMYINDVCCSMTCSSALDLNNAWLTLKWCISSPYFSMSMRVGGTMFLRSVLADNKRRADAGARASKCLKMHMILLKLPSGSGGWHIGCVCPALAVEVATGLCVFPDLSCCM